MLILLLGVSRTPLCRGAEVWVALAHPAAVCVSWRVLEKMRLHTCVSMDPLSEPHKTPAHPNLVMSGL